LCGGPRKESGQRVLASHYFGMLPGVKPFSESYKRAAVELHKASVSLKRIREQLNMSERGLRSLLAYARKNPEAPMKKSKNAGRPCKLSLGTVRQMKRLISNVKYVCLYDF
jgi:hypothetical protein